jgi:hypothetical protein
VLRISVITGTLLLALEACNRDGPVDNLASNSGGLPDINAAAPSAGGEPHADTHPARALPAASLHIPAALTGRWALTPADCMLGATAGAKALLVVSGDELRFSASRAVPAANVAADSRSISGDFDFDGQGRGWTKYEALKVDNQTLVRTEMNPTASFTYVKCT